MHDCKAVEGSGSEAGGLQVGGAVRSQVFERLLEVALGVGERFGILEKIASTIKVHGFRSG